MEEYIIDDSKAVVFTEDLKNIIYLMENTEGDILLLKSMIKRFNSQNQSLRFGTFVFGPVVMRMVHHMGNAELGLELLYDPVRFRKYVRTHSFLSSKFENRKPRVSSISSVHI